MMMYSFLWLMLLCPIAAILCHSHFIFQPLLAARLSGYCIGVGFLMAIGLLLSVSLSQTSVTFLYLSLNPLSLLLCTLILWVSFIVHRFSFRYMAGDRLYRRFFSLLSGLTCAVLIMVLSNHLWLFWGAWSLSNILLALLMVHKKEWLPAKNAGILACYTLLSGSTCLFMAFALLTVSYSTSSIDTLLQLSIAHPLGLNALSSGLILMAAVIQCGLYPFHRWLMSSLNSPTPVSAFMHAGLVNGGGILLVKFAPLLMHYPSGLTILFIVGCISALLGTFWKLMQHDIKKMLACSTMAQMGFMMMQCGVGLFAAAIAHLCWHGLFKAYLFLSSGSAMRQKKAGSDSSKASSFLLLLSLFGGLMAMWVFALMAHKPISLSQASGFVLLFAFIAGAQMMLTWIRHHRTISGFFSGAVLASFYGMMYGLSIHLIERLIPFVSTGITLHLSIIHWVAMMLFAFLWVVFNVGSFKTMSQSRWGCWLYMRLFNSSEPSMNTVTALRSHYNY